MKQALFGQTDENSDVFIYRISNENASLEVISYGAILRSFNVFGTDIVGGFDTLQGYMDDKSYQGATVGRIANRVAGAKFTIDGKEYAITKNECENCLHGGSGLSSKIWSLVEHTENKITLGYTSPDGEDGFPGELSVYVSYVLQGSTLIIDYKAYPSKKTPISLTNHSYFNLDGIGGDIRKHTLRIYADRYTAVDSSLIPTGERPSVFGTALDFSYEREIGEKLGNGIDYYDHNFLLKPEIFKSFLEKRLGLIATSRAEKLSMNVYSDQKGLQLYTVYGDSNGPLMKGGVRLTSFGAFCLEAQSEPNSVNNGVGIYDAGEVYSQCTVYEIERSE